jgi:hypothetical protein
MTKKNVLLLPAGQAWFITPRSEKSFFNGTIGALAQKFAP